MLKILLSRDFVLGRDTVLARVAQDVKRKQGGRILMVPELISHDMERRLCAVAGDTASRFAEVLSFTRLGRRVSDAVGCAAEDCLDHGGRVVAMAAATLAFFRIRRGVSGCRRLPRILPVGVPLMLPVPARRPSRPASGRWSILTTTARPGARS